MNQELLVYLSNGGMLQMMRVAAKVSNEYNRLILKTIRGFKGITKVDSLYLLL